MSHFRYWEDLQAQARRIAAFGTKVRGLILCEKLFFVGFYLGYGVELMMN